MKKLILLFVAVMAVSAANSAFAQKMASLTFSYKVLNTVKGYSYDAKLVVFVDGKKVGESTVKNQEIPNSVTVSFPQGNHSVRAVLMADYKGTWEERTIANEYSNDFVWTETGNFGKKRKISIVFDIDKGISIKGKKKSK